MTDTQDLSKDFSRYAEAYAQGRILFLIDGSGSMVQHLPQTCEAVADLARHPASKASVSAGFFCHDEPIQYVSDPADAESIYKAFPGIASGIITALEDIAHTHAGERLLHVIAITDDGTMEMPPQLQAALKAVSKKVPNLLFDMIVTDDRDRVVKHYAPAVSAAMPQATLRALHPDSLKSGLRDIIDGRIHGVAAETTMTRDTQSIRRVKFRVKRPPAPAG